MKKLYLIILSFCLTACSDSVCKDITSSIFIKVIFFLALIISIGIVFYSIKSPKVKSIGVVLTVVCMLGIYLIFTTNCNMGLK